MPRRRPALVGKGSAMRGLFVAGFGSIVREREASRHFYGDDLGTRLDAEADGYLHTEGLAGGKDLRALAARASGGAVLRRPTVARTRPRPARLARVRRGRSGGRDVGATHQGVCPLGRARVEPWGQTVTRLLAPEGILVGVTHTPSMRGPDAGSDTGREASTPTTRGESA
jgi:hypothetical protein